MTTLTTNCRTILAQLRERWDYGTAGILADAFGDAGDTLNQALWMVLAEPHEDKHRLAYAAECEREVPRRCDNDCRIPKGSPVYKRVFKVYELNGPDSRWVPCPKCHGTGTIREPHDAARAEFVRVQCELAKTKPHPQGHADEIGGRWVVNADWLCSRDDCRFCYLRCRERELWNEGMWKEFVAPWRAADGERFEWCHKGFWRRVICTAADWLRHAQAIREAQPVTRVNYTTEPTDLPLGSRLVFDGLKVWIENGKRVMTDPMFPGITFTLPDG